LACKAFESKLAEIITKRGVRNMPGRGREVKASRAKTSSNLKVGGTSGRGRVGGSHRAEADELDRLASPVRAGPIGTE